jgi:hypothetical protein
MVSKWFALAPTSFQGLIKFILYEICYLNFCFLFDGSIDSSLTSEEREQKRKQATDRATFVQGLVLSTLFGDWLVKQP